MFEQHPKVYLKIPRLPSATRLRLPTEQVRPLDHLADALETAARLVGQGHRILRVRIQSPRRPLIHIQHSALCARLGGVAMIRRHGPDGPELVMAALVGECQVIWLARGH